METPVSLCARGTALAAMAAVSTPAEAELLGTPTRSLPVLGTALCWASGCVAREIGSVKA